MVTIISENLCLDIWSEKDIVVIETDDINNTPKPKHLKKQINIKTQNKHNKNKTIKNIIMFELLIFFVGLIGCGFLIGRICKEGDYDDYD